MLYETKKAIKKAINKKIYRNKIKIELDELVTRAIATQTFNEFQATEEEKVDVTKTLRASRTSAIAKVGYYYAFDIPYLYSNLTSTMGMDEKQAINYIKNNLDKVEKYIFNDESAYSISTTQKFLGLNEAEQEKCNEQEKEIRNKRYASQYLEYCKEAKKYMPEYLSNTPEEIDEEPTLIEKMSNKIYYLKEIIPARIQDKENNATLDMIRKTVAENGNDIQLFAELMEEHFPNSYYKLCMYGVGDNIDLACRTLKDIKTRKINNPNAIEDALNLPKNASTDIYKQYKEKIDNIDNHFKKQEDEAIKKLYSPFVQRALKQENNKQ